MSLRYVCRNVARIVAQAAVLLIVCGSDVSLKGVFRVSLLPRSVVQRCCRSKASLTCVCVCVCSEVLLGSADQKHWSEVLLRTVDQRCQSGVSISSVESEVLLKSVAWKCRQCGSEVLTRSVDQKCRSEVLLRSVDEQSLTLV